MKAPEITLDRVLSDAESLPAEERAMLEELLHKRRIEEWRGQTAAAGRKAVKSFRAGKIKGQGVETVVGRLRDPR